ncbi:protein phosphatase 1 regulatory subunit 12b (myosin phosphatase targeting subunit 2), putative [Schistosoma mansoni]|uniref:protein phosphatase 1 regulatory subunit 12b (myosin phosphatase targeting subunit 2), putative n=1 Tax=Schistosoma mansoni TaxID=6183 RepID=UPI00022C8405|nr:protein phosphatase 1 regulatory subunit 12b (myosin phosphatase targeting subunit 2), putative [Schistosoma mansoni]|eukprot:XP_018645718.1 protein phosphatase 1 regulatory subunit 12b (myosin phosphatase targeting subunit 2), putative [Schistosoma mansoni]
MIQLKLSDSDICERRKAQLKEWCGSETDHASSKMREPEKIKFPLSVQLLAACSNSDLDEFSRLLKLGTDINTQNADGLTSTHLACINVDFDFLKFLISNGADINLQDHEGWTPLHAAASVGCCELARFLIENGASLSILSVDLELPIDVAQDEEMINLLTDSMKKQNIDGDTIKHSEEQMLLHDAQHWLTSGQYKPVIDPRTGATPLHVAACKDYTKAMEILLQIPGLDINAKDFDGWTALHAAAHWNREASARMLANAGASFDEHTRASQSVFDVADKEMIVLLRQLRERQRAERLSNASKLPESSKITEAVKRSYYCHLYEQVTVEYIFPNPNSTDGFVGYHSDSHRCNRSDSGDFLSIDINKPFEKTGKSISPEKSPVMVTSTTSISSDANNDYTSFISGNNNNRMEKEVSDNIMKMTVPVSSYSSSTTTSLQPGSALRHSSLSPLPISTNSVSDPTSSSTLHLNPQLIESENITDQKYESDNLRESITNKHKTGIVSIISASQNKHPIDEKSQTIVHNNTPNKELSTSSTATATTTTTATSNTPLGTGRSITKIIAVKPRRSDPQKMNLDEKESVLSVNNTQSKLSSPAPETTTNRRISVVMAPTKSGETETQRSVKARYVRSTRRSTQGVSSEDVEQAKKLADKNNNGSAVVSDNSQLMNSNHTVDASSSSDRTTSTDTSGDPNNKSIKMSHTSSASNRIYSDNPTNLFRRLTDTELLKSRSNSETVAGSGDTSIGRSSARTDYSTNERETNDTRSSSHHPASTGRHVNFSGETNMNSSTYDGNSRRSSYISKVRSSEHSPTSENKTDYTTSGGVRERRHIRERNPPERVLSSKSFSTVSDIFERRMSDHNSSYTTNNSGRSEYSPSSYTNTNKFFNTTTNTTSGTNATTVQNENDVKGIIQRPTSRFLHQSTQLVNTSSNSSSTPTYSWNPSQITSNSNNVTTGILNSARGVSTNNHNNSNNNSTNSTDYSSPTPTPRDHVSQWQDSKDYKRLYEREKEERERLQRELDKCNRQISQLRQEQQLRSSNDHSYSNAPDTHNIYNYTSSNNCNNSQIPDTEIVRLREEISKMKEENGALIRVISKLSKPI